MGDPAERVKGANAGYLGQSLLTSGNTLWRTRVRHEKKAAEEAVEREKTRQGRKQLAPISAVNYEVMLALSSQIVPHVRISS